MATLIYTIYLAKIWFIHRTLQTLQFRAVIYYLYNLPTVFNDSRNKMTSYVELFLFYFDFVSTKPNILKQIIVWLYHSVFSKAMCWNSSSFTALNLKIHNNYSHVLLSHKLRSRDTFTPWQTFLLTLPTSWSNF